MAELLLSGHANEWVGLVKSKIVASAPTFKELVNILEHKNLLKKALVTKVGEHTEFCMLKYRFVKEELHNGAYALRPKIDVKLIGERSMNFLALLDSGTDITILPRSVADFLGLEYDIKDKENFFGFGKEPFPCAKTRLAVQFNGRAQRENILLQHVPALVALTGEEQEPVLGCAGIFNSLKITFVNGKAIHIVKSEQRH